MFKFCTAPDASYARPIEELTRFDINDFTTDLRTRVYERSSFAINALNAIYQAIDKKQDHLLDVDDFRWGLLDFGVEISTSDASEVQIHYGQEGRVHWVNFLRALKVSILLHSFLNVCFYQRVMRTGMLPEKNLLERLMLPSTPQTLEPLPSIKSLRASVLPLIQTWLPAESLRETPTWNS